MNTLILYTTAGCHLCEEAETLLEQVDREAGLDWQAVDIAEEAELMERYGIRIPVVRRRDTDAELGWPFSLSELQEFLKLD